MIENNVAMDLKNFCHVFMVNICRFLCVEIEQSVGIIIVLHFDEM